MITNTILPSTSEQCPSVSNVNTETKLIRGNRAACFLAFFLVSWIIGTVLIVNRRWDENFTVLVLVFYTAQGIGAVFLGALADMRGRKSTFQLSCVLLLCGLLGVICSSYRSFMTSVSSLKIHVSSSTSLFVLLSTKPNIINSSSPSLTLGLPNGISYWILLISMSIIGIAVGSFYPLTGILLIESVQSRVVNVAGMFCMQGLGHLLVRCIAGIIFQYQPHFLFIQMFYLLMALALFIAILLTLIVFSFVHESPIFLSYGVSRHSISFSNSALTTSLLGQHQQPLSWGKYTITLGKLCKPFFWTITGTSIPWFLFDCLFYGGGNFLLIKKVKGFDSDVQGNNFAIVVLLVSLLGYILAAVLVTKIIPKLFQILGFVVLAFVFFGLALSLYSIAHSTDISDRHRISEFLGASLMYDCFFRFFNFIPNLTTFLIPLDAFPTKVRGFFVGLAFFSSRVGAITGMILNWILFEPYLSRASMLLFCAVFAVLGAAITRAATPRVVPPEEDLSKLDMIYLMRLCPRHCSGDLMTSTSKLTDDDTPKVTHQLS